MTPEQVLAKALACETVSARGVASATAFSTLHALLREAFPLLHQRLACEAVGPGPALLYRWPGTDPGLLPWAILAHQDVVGADADDTSGWSRPPFGGVIADSYVWGRGALDMKSSLVGAMQAIEGLLAVGFMPRRTLLLCLGADEELGGHDGARCIAELLRGQSERLALTLDEGGFILSGVFPGIRDDVALIGIAQRGELVLRLTARAQGGHGGMPERVTATLRLVRALDHLARRGLPGPVEGAPRRMLLALAAAAHFPWWLGYRMAAGFGARSAGLLHRAGLAALTQSTLAVTRLDAGSANNVVPTSATAVLDIRLRPGEPSDAALRRIEAEIAERFDITIVAIERVDPSQVSRTDGPLFAALSGAIRAENPGVVIVPGVSPNDSDSKFFADLADVQYRFVPARVTQAELFGIHGIDERIGVAAYHGLVASYRAIITAVDATGDLPGNVRRIS